MALSISSAATTPRRVSQKHIKGLLGIHLSGGRSFLTIRSLSTEVFIVHEFNNGELGEILQGYKYALREPTLLVTREYSERTIGLHDTARFHAIVTNTSDKPRQISLTRTVNDLPSALWQSWFCVNGVCLAPGEDTASAFLLPPGDSARVDLYVQGGTAGEGNVRLHIANDDGERSDAEFMVTTLSTSSVNEAEASRGG